MVSLQEVIDKLQDVTQDSNGFKARCPSHQDDKASLSITMGNKGIMLHCHAGCKPETIVQTLGYSMADLFLNGSGVSSNGNGASSSAPKPTKDGWYQPRNSKLEAIYDYRAADGALLYQVGKFRFPNGDKVFKPRQPAGNGLWYGKLKHPPVKMVLYRLPELLKADPDKWVYLCEGEKDADNVIGLGLVATSNQGGAGKWTDEYTKTLQGRKVCLLPHNDKSGQGHAAKVAKALHTHAAEVRILNLPNLGNKEDVSDWIARGGTADELHKLTEAAPVYQPSVTVAGSGLKTRSEMLLLALEDLGLDLRLNVLEDNVEVNGRRLDDITLSEINLKLVDEGYSRVDIADAVNVLAGRNRYHPIKDYLLGLKWDGQNHIGALIAYFQGDGTMVKYQNGEIPLHSRLIYRWHLGCVARGLDGDREDAFKHQTPMLVFISKQGIGKSTLVRWLASGVGYQFHRESPINPHSTDDIRSMVTKWIWEVSELDSSLRRSDRSSLKAFITTEWHTYRKPYGKHPITKPTLCNLVGTLNPETGFLDDPTGHRRFLPVVINSIDHSYADHIDVNQLWAQVVHLYQNGQSPELDAAEKKALQGVYKEHEVENPLETYIQMYFDVNPNDPSMKCHTATIIDRLKAFNVSLPGDARVAGRALNDVLAPMGLERAKFRDAGVAAWGWVGIEPNGKIPPP